MREIKFKAWDGEKMTSPSIPRSEDILAPDINELVDILREDWNYILVQYIGLKDKNGKEYYHKDIGEFDNGDRFIIECEDWLEFFVKWIGEPKCEDQARDLYRIENAICIGNEFKNPELLRELK